MGRLDDYITEMFTALWTTRPVNFTIHHSGAGGSSEESEMTRRELPERDDRPPDTPATLRRNGRVGRTREFSLGTTAYGTVCPLAAPTTQERPRTTMVALYHVNAGSVTTARFGWVM